MPYLHHVQEDEIFRELAKAIRLQKSVVLMGLGVALFDDSDEKRPQKHLKELLRRMIQWCIEKNLIPQNEIANDFQRMLTDGELEKVERKLQEYFTEPRQRERCINDVIEQNKQQVQFIYQLLSQMSFCAYITTSYDEILETTYREVKDFPDLLKYYKSFIDEAVISYKMGDVFILKLHGDVAVESPDAIILHNRFARSYLPEAISYPEQLRELLADVHTLFIGFEKADPDLEGLKSVVNKKDDFKRWLLLPEGHVSEEEARTLWQEDKVTVLSYAGRLELVRFLRKLAEAVATPQQVKVYISYAPEDSKLRKNLQKHFNLIESQGLKIIWNDGQISAGLEAKPAIEGLLTKADVILLLVSVDYLNAVNEKSTIKIEITRAVQRHNRGEARVIPIILRQCAWNTAPFARLEPLPPNERPLNQASNKDRAYYKVADAVRVAIEKWAEQH